MQHSADSHHNLLIADALKQLSACRRQSKACNDEVESLLSKFKRHQNEFDLLSEQLQSAQSQTPQVQAELEHAKQDAEAAKLEQATILADAAALRTDLTAAASNGLRQISIDAEIAAFQYRTAQEKTAAMKRKVQAASREHALAQGRLAALEKQFTDQTDRLHAATTHKAETTHAELNAIGGFALNTVTSNTTTASESASSPGPLLKSVSIKSIHSSMSDASLPIAASTASGSFISALLPRQGSVVMTELRSPPSSSTPLNTSVQSPQNFKNSTSLSSPVSLGSPQAVKSPTSALSPTNTTKSFFKRPVSAAPPVTLSTLLSLSSNAPASTAQSTGLQPPPTAASQLLSSLKAKENNESPLLVAVRADLANRQASAADAYEKSLRDTTRKIQRERKAIQGTGEFSPSPLRPVTAQPLTKSASQIAFSSPSTILNSPTPKLTPFSPHTDEGSQAQVWFSTSDFARRTNNPRVKPPPACVIRPKSPTLRAPLMNSPPMDSIRSPSALSRQPTMSPMSPTTSISAFFSTIDRSGTEGDSEIGEVNVSPPRMQRTSSSIPQRVSSVQNFQPDSGLETTDSSLIPADQVQPALPMPVFTSTPHVSRVYSVNTAVAQGLDASIAERGQVRWAKVQQQANQLQQTEREAELLQLEQSHAERSESPSRVSPLRRAVTSSAKPVVSSESTSPPRTSPNKFRRAQSSIRGQISPTQQSELSDEARRRTELERQQREAAAAAAEAAEATAAAQAAEEADRAFQEAVANAARKKREAAALEKARTNEVAAKSEKDDVKPTAPQKSTEQKAEGDGCTMM